MFFAYCCITEELGGTGLLGSILHMTLKLIPRYLQSPGPALFQTGVPRTLGMF